MKKKSLFFNNKTPLSPFENHIFQTGFRNFHFVSHHPQNIWPLWIKRQLIDRSHAFSIDNNIQCLSNTRYRNWVVLGEPYIDDFIVIDEAGLTHIQIKIFQFILQSK